MTTVQQPFSETLVLPTGDEAKLTVDRLVDSLCERFKIGDSHYGNILVALSEAITNAIQHGNKNNPAKKITFSYTATPAEIQFSIEDEGTGFDYDHLPDPTAPENIEKPNGRGVFLMRHLAERVGFEKDGRLVKLEFALNKPA